MKALRFVQALALLPACATTPAPTPEKPAPTPVTAGSQATVSSSSTVDPTAGDGPCRCSWETNAAIAPRVCKKGEKSHTGEPCVAGEHNNKVYPMEGPLPPPDLLDQRMARWSSQVSTASGNT